MSVTRDAEDNRPHYVYRCFDAEDRLLYIGCALDVEDRIAWHLIPSTQSAVSVELQDRMVRHEAIAYANKAEARTAEALAIRDEAPLLNRQHNPTRWKKAPRGGWTPVAA